MIKKSLGKSEKLHFFIIIVILVVSYSRALISQQWIKKEKHVSKNINFLANNTENGNCHVRPVIFVCNSYLDIF